jgi:hypothetical protein
MRFYIFVCLEARFKFYKSVKSVLIYVERLQKNVDVILTHSDFPFDDRIDHCGFYIASSISIIQFKAKPKIPSRRTSERKENAVNEHINCD